MLLLNDVRNTVRVSELANEIVGLDRSQEDLSTELIGN